MFIESSGCAPNYRPLIALARETRISVCAICLAAFATMLPAILNRYLFLDETWYVLRERLFWANGWGALGRPLLHYPMLATEHIEAALGMNAIYVYRLVGVLLLAMTAALMSSWLGKFEYRRFDATLYSIGLISLPAFQVLAATSVQLGNALIAAMLAIHLIWPVVTNDVTHRGRLYRIAGGIALCFVALCIYQISFLIVFAMLLIPVLKMPSRDIRSHVSLAAVYLALAAITAAYYGGWKLLYVAPVDGSNQQYSPHSATLPSVISGLETFIPGAFRQVANLWYVEDTQPSLFFYASALLVLMSFVRLLYAERLLGVLKITIAVGTLLVCDIFRMAAPNHPPTYTTLHALSAAWWLLIVWSIDNLLRKSYLARYVALALGAIGVVFSIWTTGYIVQHNAPQFRAIADAVRTKPTLEKLHVFAAASNFPQLYEYGWASGVDTSYTLSMANFIANRISGRRPEVRITGAAVPGPSGVNECQRPDLAIRLPSPSYSCAGAACALSDAELDRIDWKTCEPR